jgi:hypothetical protein
MILLFEEIGQLSKLLLALTLHQTTVVFDAVEGLLVLSNGDPLSWARYYRSDFTARCRTLT